MTPETRGRILRLAIAVNLAIVATGVALLFPSEPVVLLAAYVAATGFAAWKGGWEGGVLATAMSTAILLMMFSATFDESHVIGFIAAGVIVTAIIEAARPRRRLKQAVAAEPPPQFGRLVAVNPPLDERERLSAERRELAKSLERAAAAQLEEQRQVAQRAAEDAKVARLTGKSGKRNDRSKRG
jgi:glucose-6-phosphate-specific signal transduction histidine kinase